MPTVRTNDVDTYYERRGNGPPLLFVHGALLDHSEWDAQVEALSSDYTTIAYDVRGHGRTGESPRSEYSMELFASDLDELVTELDLDKPVLCGHSTGGCIAQLYAATHPERISGLVLADTFTPAILDRMEWLQRSVMLRAVVPPVQFVSFERVERAMVWLHERISGRGAGGDYDAIEALRRESPPISTAEFTKVIRAVRGFERVPIDYSAIEVPTLVMYGEDDLPFVHRHAARLAADVPDATVERIPDAGHAANLDNPEAFTATLRAFLDELEIPDGPVGHDVATRS